MNEIKTYCAKDEAGRIDATDSNNGASCPPNETSPPTGRRSVPRRLLHRVKAYFESKDLIRRGVCLLNAGKYEQAGESFSRAASINPNNDSLASLLAAAYLGQSKPDAAAEQFDQVVRRQPDNVTARIRQALSLWSGGHEREAVQLLRDGLAQAPDNAELQFQLGTLLASMQQYEEAEVRFAQTLAIDRDHVEASVSLGLCYGARERPREAVKYLQRAHQRRSGDAGIGLLLAQAVRAADQKGEPAHLRLSLPPTRELEDDDGIQELSRIIAQDPDFVDALMSVPVDDVNEELYATLLQTIKAALEHQPEHAELQYHCGRVLDRLGQTEAAIAANERAVQLNPTHTRALIDLAKLYQRTDRTADAAERLEQVVSMGCDYADVYYMLGNVHRAGGRIERAGEAYRQALSINHAYEDAQKALASLEMS